jgi:hypothetical protein
VLAVLVRFTDYSIVHNLLLPTLLVGITIIPLESILTPWCLVSGRSVDVFPSWRLAALRLTASSVLTFAAEIHVLRGI